MDYSIGGSVEGLVNILLQFGDRVIEVSRGQVMTRIWDRDTSPLIPFKNRYLGRKISEIRNDSTISRCREAIERAFATGENSYAEYISYNNDIDSILTFSFRVLNCHPDKEYVFLVFENITRGNEQLLVEDKWKMALDASDQGVWDVNMENGTIHFSRKWEELFGYSSDEIWSVDQWAALVHPEDVIIANKRKEDYFSGRVSRYFVELRYRCKNGAYKWILSRGVIVSRTGDGSPLRFIGTHTDISEQKKAEDALRQANQTFYNFFYNSGTGKALLSPDGQWIEVNNAFCDLTGFNREELKQLTYRVLTYPDDVHLEEPLINKLLSKELATYSTEKRFIAKNRQVVTAIVTVSLVWGRDEPIYFICDIIDITNKLAMADELKLMNSDLEAAAANLQRKNSQLEEVNNMIVHDLRGPAGNILMLSGKENIFSEAEAMDLIHEASQSLLANLDMMVEIARIKLNKEVPFDICNFQSLIEGITRQLHAVIYKEHIRLTMKLGVAEITYPCVYLQSILYNLISNAIKYRRPDVPLTIEIGTERLNGHVVLNVTDNGLGIDMEQYGSKVFKLNQVFHQGYDSKGVGLFITKTQIESLGGTIALQSRPEEGCTFTITF